jgi:large subunit ribosomal protein L24e
MVLKTQTCRFSGLRIYPGKGILFIRIDGQVTNSRGLGA